LSQPEVNLSQVVRTENRWGSCIYCDFDEGVNQPLTVSPIWPHPVKCPRCHRSWKTAEIYNVETKGMMEAFLKWNVTSDMRSDEERRADDAMDEGIERRVKEAKKDPLFPYNHPDDKPIRIIVPGTGKEN